MKYSFLQLQLLFFVFLQNNIYPQIPQVMQSIRFEPIKEKCDIKTRTCYEYEINCEISHLGDINISDISYTSKNSKKDIIFKIYDSTRNTLNEMLVIPNTSTSKLYKNQKLMHSIFVSNNGTLYIKQVNKYFSESSDIVSKTYDKKNKLYYIYIRKYDKYNRLMELIGQIPDGSIDQRDCFYYYESDDKLSKIISYKKDFNNSIYSSYDLYKYDNIGNIIEIEGYDSENNLSSIKSYTYNSSNKILTKVSRQASSTDFYLTNYEYDSNGNEIGTMYYHNNTLCMKSFKRYDTMNNTVLSIELYINGQNNNLQVILGTLSIFENIYY